MALIKCKECGKEISDKAKTCPNCGCPIFKEVVKKIKKKKWEELTYEEKMKISSYRKLQKNWWITERVVTGLCGIIGSIFLFISFFVEWFLFISFIPYIIALICVPYILKEQRKWYKDNIDELYENEILN